LRDRDDGVDHASDFTSVERVCDGALPAIDLGSRSMVGRTLRRIIKRCKIRIPWACSTHRRGNLDVRIGISPRFYPSFLHNGHCKNPLLWEWDSCKLGSRIYRVSLPSVDLPWGQIGRNGLGCRNSRVKQVDSGCTRSERNQYR